MALDNAFTPDLHTDIGGLTLANPVMTAFGYFRLWIRVCRHNRYLAPWRHHCQRYYHNLSQRQCLPAYGRNPFGNAECRRLAKQGRGLFIQYIYPGVRTLGSPIVVNVSGATIDDYIAVCQNLRRWKASQP